MKIIVNKYEKKDINYTTISTSICNYFCNYYLYYK